MAAVVPEWLKDASGGTELLARLSPRAGTNSINEPRAGRLQLRVTAAPEDGHANEAACKLIAKALRIGKTSVSVVSGPTSRDKTFLIEGRSAQEVADVLAS
jgi:uncharacterized protein YggU (UPF0235/DUF167 family)